MKYTLKGFSGNLEFGIKNEADIKASYVVEQIEIEGDFSDIAKISELFIKAQLEMKKLELEARKASNNN